MKSEKIKCNQKINLHSAKNDIQIITIIQKKHFYPQKWSTMKSAKVLKKSAKDPGTFAACI